MKDKECKSYIHTYKCSRKNCTDCPCRYKENELKEKLNELAIQTDTPVYTGDTITDYYVRVSDVEELFQGLK